MTKRRLSLSKKVIIIGLLVVAVVGSLVYWQHSKDTTVNTDVKKQPTSNPYINLKPATSQQKQDSETAKDGPPPSSTSTKTITPIISSASKTGVAAYIQGINEDGGKCTATFTQDGTARTFSSNGVSNVSYTTCQYINVTGLGSGSWKLVVTYTSSNASGTSQPVEVN